MLKNSIPSLCLPCIQRFQAQCPHNHTSTWGGYYLDAGDVWDDVIQVCDDCGAILDDLSSSCDSLSEDIEIPI